MLPAVPAMAGARLQNLRNLLALLFLIVQGIARSFGLAPQIPRRRRRPEGAVPEPEAREAREALGRLAVVKKWVSLPKRIFS